MFKLSYKTLFIIFFFLLIGVVVLARFVLPKNKVSAAWWNDSWHYRVAVNIGNTGSNLSNFQTSISIGTSTLISSGKMQSDCDDIRVTDTNGNLLTYWVSGCGTTATQIWPKITSIPNGGATVYIYYGNPSASSTRTQVGTSDYPGLSCKSILDAGNSTGNGNYWIDPTNGDTSDKFQAYCDMTNDSGGWMLITQSMINSEVGASTTVTKTTGANNGLIYTTTINNSGCTGSTYSRVYFNDIIPWTQIKADYQFLGGNSCWAIFGNTGYNAGTNLITFSSGTDTIRNQVKMGGSNGDNFDGVTGRCDNETFNFWHSNQGVGTTRSAQVILRRNSMASLAGLGTGVGCVSNGYPWKYENIYIRETNMTFTATAGSLQSEEISPAPIAYWKFDEGSSTTAYDSAGNTNGNLLGSTLPTWQDETQCISGKCLLFNGSSSYINTGTLQSLPIFSIEAWIKANPGSNSDYRTIVDKSNGMNDRNFWLALETSTSQLSLRFSVGGVSTTFTANTALNDNKWHHVVATYDNSYVRLYVDGKLDTAPISKTGIPNSGPVNSFIGNQSGTRFFYGSIDDVKIYPYARTATQIKQDYNSRGSSKGSSINLGVKSNTAPSLKSKLVAYYKFDENNGTTAYNSNSNNNHGTLTNSPIWFPGKIGNALEFLNSGSEPVQPVGIPGTGILENITDTSYSFSAWIKPFNNSSTQYAISRPGYHSGLAYSTSQKMQCGVWNSTNNPFTVSSNGTYPPNSWYFVTCTIDDANKIINVYVNGKFDGSVSYSGTLRDYGTIQYNIGSGYHSGLCSDSSRFCFNGLVDEFKLYNTVLTADEVKQDYNSGVATQFGSTNQTIGGTTTDLNYCIPGDTSYCASPIAEWNLEENTGTIAKDISGNNNTGTINNPIWTAGPKGKGSALSFNGTSAMISADHNPIFNFGTGDFTIEFWLNYKGPTVVNNTYGLLVAKEIGAGSSTPGFTSAISTYGGNGSNYGVLFSTTNGAWGTGNVEHTGSYLPNNWYHVVGVRSGNTFTVYKNGQYGTSRTAAGIGVDVNNTTFLKIGGRSPWGYVNGSMDDIKIYNYARTPAQIAYDYNKGAPIAHWKLDECQGLTAFDASGLGNTGTISIGSGGSQNSIGTCQIGTSAAWTNGASGKINGSLNFDGIDDRITFSNNIFPSTMNEFSVSVWVYQKSYGTSGSSRPYISNWNTWSVGSQKGFLLRSYDTLNYPSFIVCDGTNYYSVNSTPIIPLNTWTHLVGVFKGGSILKIYMNGKEAGNSGSIPSQFVKESTSLYMGYSGINTGYMDGQIDDARIYNYSLTPEQVKTVYNNGAINFQ